jgi:hypothetical protein
MNKNDDIDLYENLAKPYPDTIPGNDIELTHTRLLKFMYPPFGYIKILPNNNKQSLIKANEKIEKELAAYSNLFKKQKKDYYNLKLSHYLSAEEFVGVVRIYRNHNFYFLKKQPLFF